MENAPPQCLSDSTAVFSFLDFLVNVVANRVRGPKPLAQLITEGLVQLTQAAGAAIYLADKGETQLLPESVLAGFPPLIPLPKELRESADDGHFLHPSLISFLKLSPASVCEGPLGECFASKKAANFPSMKVEHGAFMLAPICYGSRELGVLALARKPLEGAYSEADFGIFQGLSGQIGFALGSALIQEEAAEKRRMQGELESAREVQRLLLPDKDPVLPGFIITGKNVAARVVSGDYYDYIPVDAAHLGVVIADVSGKGIPASLVMATCRGLLRGLAQKEISPSAALAQVNRSIYEDMKEDMFISAAYVMLRPGDSKATLCRAGHDAPLLYKHVTKSVEPIEAGGLAMGVDEGDVFERVTKDQEFEMLPGDCLLLYTDGINEAENTQGNEFGMTRLIQTFALAAPQGASAVISAIQMAIAAHMGKSPQSDDVTMVAIQRCL